MILISTVSNIPGLLTILPLQCRKGLSTELLYRETGSPGGKNGKSKEMKGGGGLQVKFAP